MITSAFLNIFYSVISFMISGLPTVSTNSNIVTTVTTANTYISAVYAFIPLITITLLAIITFDIIFEASYFLYKVIYWVIRRFPTQS
jgi:hypothetical protein